MAYNKSRDKGKKTEYLVRDYFRAHGYQAHRVPASGAAQGFPGDIQVISPTGEEVIVEVKARKDEFKKIYEYYESGPSGPVYLCLGLEGTVPVHLIALSDKYSDLLGELCYTIITEPSVHEKRLLKLKKYLGKASILVLKGDRKPLLFLRFE